MANGNQSQIPIGSSGPQMLPAPKSKTWVWAVIVIVALLVLLFAVYYYYYGYTPVPSGTVEEGLDSTAAIEQDLRAVDLGGLDAELGSIEKELQ